MVLGGTARSEPVERIARRLVRRHGLAALARLGPRDWQAERVAEGRPSPTVNGAVATGRILFGAVGDETRLEYTVIGDAVNLSAKLEKANKELGARAVCDVASYELAVEQGYRPPEDRLRHAGIEIAGTDRPMDVVVVDA